jgi:hypothetical protein
MYFQRSLVLSDEKHRSYDESLLYKADEYEEIDTKFEDFDRRSGISAVRTPAEASSRVVLRSQNQFSRACSESSICGRDNGDDGEQVNRR